MTKPPPTNRKCDDALVGSRNRTPNSDFQLRQQVSPIPEPIYVAAETICQYIEAKSVDQVLKFRIHKGIYYSNPVLPAGVQFHITGTWWTRMGFPTATRHMANVPLSCLLGCFASYVADAKREGFLFKRKNIDSRLVLFRGIETSGQGTAWPTGCDDIFVH